MSIVSLLNEGLSKTFLEKAADKILYAPRKMWAKQVQVSYNPQSSKFSKIEKGDSLHHRLWSSLSDEKKSDAQVFALGTVYGVFYALSSTVLALPLALGLSLKKIALKQDKKSLYYNKMVQNLLKLESYSEKRSALIQSKEETDLKIRNLETFLAMPVAALSSRIVQSWQLELMSQKSEKDKITYKLDQVATKIQSIKNDLAYYELKYENT